MSEDLIWNWISAVVGYTWYWWDDAVDRDWSKCFYVCLCALAVAELFHVAHKLVDLYATSAVRTLRLLRLLPSRMFCIGLVCFYIVYCYLYIDFLCTATYRYFLQLEMHVRLICVIKLYFLHPMDGARGIVFRFTVHLWMHACVHGCRSWVILLLACRRL